MEPTPNTAPRQLVLLCDGTNNNLTGSRNDTNLVKLAELLAADDVEHLAAAMEPGTTAGVLIWENLWAAPFASAARRSGGQLIANGRIPIQAIVASIEADIASSEGN
jgi:hypothetical protein